MYDIYPRTIARAALSPKLNRCFLLMPFDPSFDGIYQRVSVALEERKFTVMRADSMFVNRAVLTTIVQGILTSHFIIAELTGNNPNVLYELGLAHSFRDGPNVILITQNKEDVPFNLRHLRIMDYDPSNMDSFLAKLTEYLVQNRTYFPALVRLRERYRTQIGSDAELEDTYEFLVRCESEVWHTIAGYLGVEAGPVALASLLPGMWLLRAELVHVLTNERISLFNNTFLLFKDILASVAHEPEVTEYALEVLRTNRFRDFPRDEAASLGMTIDFALALFSNPQMRPHVVRWIFDYLSRPKIAGVDVQRARVEQFVLRSDNAQLHEALKERLGSENARVREIAADFLGEMRDATALDVLIDALTAETDPFVTRSIFSALKKIGRPEAGPAVIDWVVQHRRVISTRKLDYVLESAVDALSSIDRQSGTLYVTGLMRRATSLFQDSSHTPPQS